MEIIKRIINNVEVTFIKTNKFKSIAGALYFTSKVTKDKITKRGFLRNVLLESTKKYDSNEKLNINCLENYDASYSAGVTRLGNYITNSFYFETLHDNYTRKGNLENVLNTFYEIIFNPHVDNNSFNKKSFELNYRRRKSSFERRKESQRLYAEQRILTFLNQDKAYSYDIDIETIENTTASNLYDEYKDMINNSYVKLIVVGNIDPYDCVFEKLLKDIKQNDLNKSDLYINNDDENNSYKDIAEENDGAQSVLHLLCYLKNITEYELHYVMPIYRVILGNPGASRLFDSVREKNSLAYYCFARLEKDDKLLEVIAGVSNNNYEKALKLIKEELSKMTKITEEELSNAKKELISSLLESQDSIYNVVSRRYNEEVFDLPRTDEFIDKLNNVTKEEVENIYKKVDLGLSYFLKGSENDG